MSQRHTTVKIKARMRSSSAEAQTFQTEVIPNEVYGGA